MPKSAVSVTLADENLIWLKGRALKAHDSLSAILDHLVSQARSGQLATSAGVRTVAGTIDLSIDDPDLSGADEAVRGLFSESLMRPSVVREVPVTYGGRRKSRKSRRG